MKESLPRKRKLHQYLSFGESLSLSPVLKEIRF